MEQSTLVIVRPKAAFGKLKKLAVLIDGEEVGQLANDSTIQLTVAPGKHGVKVAMEAYTSKLTQVDFPEGGEVKLSVVMPPLLFPIFLFITTPGAAFRLVGID